MSALDISWCFFWTGMVLSCAFILWVYVWWAKQVLAPKTPEKSVAFWLDLLHLFIVGGVSAPVVSDPEIWADVVFNSSNVFYCVTAPGLAWGLFGQSLFRADVMPMDKIFALLILFGWMIPWFRIKVAVHCFRSKVPFWQTLLALCAIVIYFWPEMLLGLLMSISH